MLNEVDKLAVLIEEFDALFLKSENTRLKTGATEPYYRAPTDNQPAIIYSRDNYYSSALHEIAHWCIAGVARRQLDDFGYWYQPEGRTAAEQIEFELVEVKPQAIEWALSLASDHQFHFSADNLEQGIDASDEFKSAVYAQLSDYLTEKCLPPRAQLLFNRLVAVFRQAQPVVLPIFKSESEIAYV